MTPHPVVARPYILLLLANTAGGAVGGLRSARFFKYLKFFKLKYLRFLRIGLRMRSMSGSHITAIYRKACEPDTPKAGGLLRSKHSTDV